MHRCILHQQLQNSILREYDNDMQLKRILHYLNFTNIVWLKCIWSRIDTQTCVTGVFKRSHSNVLPICIFDESWTSVGYSKLSTTNITLSCDCSTITRGNAFYFSFLKCSVTFVCFSMTFLNIIPCSLIPTFWKVTNNLSLLEHQSKVKV